MTGHFALSVRRVAADQEPCSGGRVMIEDAATIVLPESNYGRNQECIWTIECATVYDVVTLTFASFDTELDHDYVVVHDGADPSAADLSDRLSGDSLEQSTFVSTGQSMRLNFQSDDHDHGNAGFEAEYTCGPSGASGSHVPEPEPEPEPAHEYLKVHANGNFTTAEIDADGSVWFSFLAVEETTYQLNTETLTLTDTAMTLYGLNAHTVIAENNDDFRATGRGDSYIEWTCPETGNRTRPLSWYCDLLFLLSENIPVLRFGLDTGLYYIQVVPMRPGDTGTFSLGIITAQDSGGEPCSVRGPGIFPGTFSSVSCL